MLNRFITFECLLRLAAWSLYVCYLKCIQLNQKMLGPLPFWKRGDRSQALRKMYNLLHPTLKGIASVQKNDKTGVDNERGGHIALLRLGANQLGMYCSQPGRLRLVWWMLSVQRWTLIKQPKKFSTAYTLCMSNGGFSVCLCCIWWNYFH